MEAEPIDHTVADWMREARAPHRGVLTEPALDDGRPAARWTRAT
jgi:hypothetical protein